MDGHAKLALRRQNPCDPAAAAHSHILGQCDFGGHHEGQFDCIASRDLKISVEKRSASAQVLGKTAALTLGARQANSNRKLEVEALRSAALKVNWSVLMISPIPGVPTAGLIRRVDTAEDYLRALQEIPRPASILTKPVGNCRTIRRRT